MPKLRVVLFSEDSVWIAQCIEHDIAAFGASIQEVRENLLITLDAEAVETKRATGVVFGGIAPAPAEFLERWEKNAGNFIPSEPVSLPNGLSLSDFADEYALCA